MFEALLEGFSHKYGVRYMNKREKVNQQNMGGDAAGTLTAAASRQRFHNIINTQG